MQQAAKKRLEEIGMPTEKSEPFRYVKLRHLLPIQPALQEGSYTIDGAIALSSAVEQFSGYFQERERLIEKEEDPFALLNSATSSSGHFLYVPPRQHIEKRAYLDHSEETCVQPRLYISIGKGASLKLSLLTKVNQGFVNSYIDIHLEEGASLTLLSDSRESGSQTCHLETMRITQKRDSTSQITLLTNGSKTSRFSISTSLEGEGASSDVAGLFEMNEKNEAHAFLEMRHLAPHTRSNQLFKHLLRGCSHTSFEGKIFVDPRAQKTEAYQLNSNWILSDLARAESKPNLEIFADDVKASHGATFGKPEQDEIFYLRARGFSESEALDALTAGFREEILCRL